VSALLYTQDTDLGVAIPVHDGDLVPIHEGCHPVVKAPGTNAYYLTDLTKFRSEGKNQTQI
jgi:5-deoxy-D-glucuronate isomerase